jgi:LmbE family N-acetylglucosaminyl deacetylase
VLNSFLAGAGAGWWWRREGLPGEAVRLDVLAYALGGRRPDGAGRGIMEAAMNRLMLIGAHPDDCEWMAGGLAIRCARAGWRVRFVSVTNGGSGHHEMSRAALIRRRAAEARRAAGRIGADAITLDEPDGGVYVTPRATDKVIAAIRAFRPDVVVTHRDCDYHRDHRYTARLVLDASFLLQVPKVCPRVPPLAAMPVILYAADHFTEGPAFRPQIVLDTTREQPLRTRMLLDHASQFLEWIPWVNGDKSKGRRRPADPNAVARFLEEHPKRLAKRFRRELRARYRRPVAAAEAFQISEYGRRRSPSDLRTLIPG